MQDFIVGIAVLASLMILAMIAVIVIIAIASRYVVGPIDAAARDRRSAVQLTLADVLCLFVLLQIALGLVHYYFGGAGEDVATVAAMDVLAAILLVVHWWTMVLSLSRAGIHRVSTRVWKQLVVLPLFCAVVFVLPAALVWMSFAALGFAIPFPGLLAVETLIVVAIFAVRRIKLSLRPVARPKSLDDGNPVAYVRDAGSQDSMP